MVVGTNTRTCLLLQTALNAARTATSVLPKPTSPQTNLSIGCSLSMSFLISFKLVDWSGVSWNKNDDSSSDCK